MTQVTENERKREKKSKKEKKVKKEKKEGKSRKRKHEEEDHPEEGSIASSTTEVDVSENTSKSPQKKKIKLLAGLLEKVNGEAEKDYNKEILMKGAKSLDEYKDTISKASIQSLEDRGINSLFEIQVRTLPIILSGRDVIGRARTGMGKTLAFALPVIEQLFKNKSGYSRDPKVIVLAPTRELAKQVSKEFQATAPTLKVLTVYGGVSISDQIRELRNGIDIVVGTPGRVMDHIERRTLNLGSIKHLILDEADQMLDMGFKEEMDSVFDSIFEATGFNKTDLENKPFQVLLFSATLPTWVHSVAKEKMNSPEVIDLVGDFESASKDVEHLCIQCPWQNENRANLIHDLVKMHAGSKLGRAIVFCNMKRQCDELACERKLAKMSKVIHGDITQAQRESTLEGFRNGMFKILIATDVAARGLDIKNVDLVVNCEPPSLNQNYRNQKAKFSTPRADVDTYVHRSGRTGRAGKKGVCVTLFTPKQMPIIKAIEDKTSNKLLRIGSPQTDDLLVGAARSSVEDMLAIPEKVYTKFGEIAGEMIEAYGAEKALSLCLAKLTGFDEAKSIARKSLLASEHGYVTVKYENTFKNPGEIRLGYVWSILRRIFASEPEVVERVKGMTMLKNELGTAFDLPQDAADKLQERIVNGDKDVDGFEICEELPEVQHKDFGGGNRSDNRRPNSFGFGGRGRGRGGGGRGFGGRGRGRGYSRY